MAHIRLDIGADRSASLKTMREDLSAIVDALNKEPKLKQIKLGLDMASWDKEVSKIKSDINEVRKSFAGTNTATGLGIKATNITGEIKPALSAIEQFNQRIKKIGVDNLDEGRLLNLFSSIGDALREDKVLADNFCEAVNKTYGVKYLEHLIFAVQRYSQNITTATELSKEFDSITNRQFTTEIPALATVDEQSINQLKALRSILRKSDLGWDDPYSKKKFSTYQASSTQLLSAIEQHATSAQLKVLGLQRGLISLSDVQGVLRSLAVNTGAISYNDGYGLDTFKTNSTRIREAISAHKEYEQQIASDNAALSELRNALVSTFGELPSEGGALVVTLDQLKQVESEAPAAMEYIIQIQRQINGGLFKQELSPAPVLEEVKTSVDQVVSSEQSLESATETVKGIFGSGINSEQLIGKLDEIRLAIDRIVESLTNLSAKEVKIKFDDASLENLRTQISQLLTEMSAITPRAKRDSGGGGSDNSAAKESKLAYDEARRAITNYYKALSDLRTIKGNQDITLEADGWHSENVELQGLVATLNNTKTAYDLVISAMKEMPVEQQVKLQQLLTTESTKYTIAVEKQVAAERAAAAAAAKKKSDASAAKESKLAYDEARRAIEAYYSLVGKVNGTNGDVTRTQTGWVSKSGDNAQLASSLNNAEKAYTRCTNAAAANVRTREQNIQLERLEIAETDKLARSLEEQANKARPAAETEAAHRALMQSTLGTTNRAADVLRDYQHVMKGHNETSRQAYENLKSQKVVLDDVRKKYDSGAASAEDLRKAQDNVKTATKEATETFKANGEHVSSLGARIKGLATKFMSWLGVSQVIMYAVRAIKKMISASIEIDAAMTQLKIVTNATDSEMKQFSNTAITLAKSLGKSVIELTKSIETFSRLGYSLKDASELAKYATIMSNVAGVGNDEATTGITSIVKGFNLNVSDAEHVADVLVDVGQKYAVSAGELMEAYEKSGAALSATNTSLEKSAGLIAAANASVQDASIVGKEMPSLTVMWEQVKNYIG